MGLSLDLSAFEIVNQQVFQRQGLYRVTQRSQKFRDFDLSGSSYDPSLSFVNCITIILTSDFRDWLLDDSNASSGLIWESLEMDGADVVVFFVNNQEGAFIDVNSNLVPALF